jgi:carboxymethylenebutenolidase
MKKFATPGALLTLFLCLQPSFLSAAESAQGSPAIYFTSAPPVFGYLAKPEGAGPHPAIILIHEWWGLNDDIRARARDFADQSYVALAVDMYGGPSTTDPLVAGQLAGAVRKDMDNAFKNLQAAVAFIKDQPNVDSQRIASIGWCFGGGWSFQMAKNDLGVSASVIYYGRFNPADDLDKMRAEIIGHFAENDTVVNIDDVKASQARLSTLNGDHEIYIYPNTTHGFASRRGANPMYVEEAADQA